MCSDEFLEFLPKKGISNVFGKAILESSVLASGFGLKRFPFVWKNREELSGKRNRKIFLGQNGTRRACSFYTDLR